MFTKIALCAFLLSFLMGCDSAKSQAQQLVLAELKDPSSAEFGAYKEVLSKHRDWACLAVNARNSYGGYTGEQAARFVRTAGSLSWKFQGIAPQSFEGCVTMITDFQPYEGGPR